MPWTKDQDYKLSGNLHFWYTAMKHDYTTFKLETIVPVNSLISEGSYIAIITSFYARHALEKWSKEWLGKKKASHLQSLLGRPDVEGMFDTLDYIAENINDGTKDGSVFRGEARDKYLPDIQKLVYANIK